MSVCRLREKWRSGGGVKKRNDREIEWRGWRERETEGEKEGKNCIILFG